MDNKSKTKKLSSIKYKIMIPIILVIFLLSTGLTFFSILNTKKIINQNEKNESKLLESLINTNMQSEVNVALTSIKSIVNNPEIAKAFSQRDRSELSRLIDPIFKELKVSGVEQLQFHEPSSVSFYRAHSPQKYGDDLSSIRKMVVDVNKSSQESYGLEQGKEGYGFRAVVPVLWEGKKVGTAEVGMEFGIKFLEKLKEMSPGEYYIYTLTDDLKSSELLVGTTDSGEKINENILKKVISGETSILESKDLKNRILIIPVKDYSGTIKGYIQAVTSRVTILEYLKQMESQILLISIVGLIIAIVLTFLISLQVTKPIKKLAIVSNELTNENWDVSIDINSKDEIGQLANSMKTLVANLKMYTTYINEISSLLDQLGNGNLNLAFEQTYDKGFAIIKNALLKTSSMLNTTLLQINDASNQVASASDQVSQSAMALSQGATEQASSIEEFSATISDISNHIQQNAQNTNKAKDISINANEATIRGQQQMQDMIDAMNEISNKSNEISKIIKNIDDIAFQTNILALNAAVEAARAGTAGKGFSVVAEEVRNLASKSAESAKDTALLIESSLKAIENGTHIASETAKSLDIIVKESKNSLDIIENIADATNEQAISISQVNIGIEQISSIIQANSATAEESAATSEELSGQALILKDLISKFKFKND